MRSSEEPRTVHLSPVSPDPLASLDISGAVIEWDGDLWRIPHKPAVDWLRILLADTIDEEDIFPGMCGDAAVLDVNERLMQGAPDDIERLALEVLEVISGRRWWITLRLARVVRENWEMIGGTLALHGVDPRQVSLSWWLDAAYTVLIERLVGSDAKRAAEFTAALVATPPSERTEVDEEAEGNAFLAAMRMAQAGR